MDQPDWDVVVVGAGRWPFWWCNATRDGSKKPLLMISTGVHGLALARFYLDTHPECRLLILEASNAIGGVWSTERVFDEFWSQSSVRMTSFSDVPLELPAEAPMEHGNFPASYVTEYLESYVDTHVYHGQSLRQRIRLQTRVEQATKINDLWSLRVAGSVPPATTISCKRLAVATGMTSKPRVPAAFRLPDCTLPVCHHRDFGLRRHSLLGPGAVHSRITVVGAGKSAADLVYAALKADKQVSWLIRKSGGRGPGMFLEPKSPPGYQHPSEAATNRNACEYNPSAWRPPTTRAAALHQSHEGRAKLRRKFAAIDERCKEYASYTDRDGARPGFEDLEPKQSYWWNTCAMALVQHDDFWDLVSRNVDVYIGDVDCTTSSAIRLTDGRLIPTDAVLCGTGWETDLSFIDADISKELGLPRNVKQDPQVDDGMWEELTAAAAQVIKTQYPILEDGCSMALPDENRSPVRLYRCLAPLDDHSILFLGVTKLATSFRGAEAQAVWATAYWDGKIKLPSREERIRSIAHGNAFSRLRYPTTGANGNNNNADFVWYTDTLLCDAGLVSHRREWYSDWAAPCLASDLRDCAKEYLQIHG